MTNQNKAREALEWFNSHYCKSECSHYETIRRALSAYERLQRVNFDTVKEIEERWGDRFLELEEPAPKGTKRIGYVVDIHFLLTQLKAARIIADMEE